MYLHQLMNSSSKTHACQGFSLVEVVLSLGIVSFAFVALLGLLPVGLQTYSSAVDATVGTQIAQGVITAARQAKFTELPTLDVNPGADERTPSFPAPDYFFDEQGKPGTEDNYIYSAAVTVANPAVVPAATAATNPNLAAVTVTVRKISTPAQGEDFTVFIADNGL